MDPLSEVEESATTSGAAGAPDRTFNINIDTTYMSGLCYNVGEQMSGEINPFLRRRIGLTFLLVRS